MIRKIDHVGIAVSSIGAVAKTIYEAFGFKEIANHVSSEGGFISKMVKGSDAVIELIEPAGTEGGIRRFVEKHGNCLHHVSFEVDDIASTINEMRELGVIFINPAPELVGIDKVAFINPRSTAGVLIELVQKGSL